MADKNDEYFMGEAFEEACKALESEEVPIGAIVCIGTRIIGRGHNQVELLNDPTAHAEMIALTAAFNYVGSKYLPDATIYITLEPCLMCAGALYWSKIGRIVWGAGDEKNGFRKSMGSHLPFHPKTKITQGILAPECAGLLINFFKSRRNPF